MKILFHAYECEFTGKVFRSESDARQCEIDNATKVVAAVRNAGELRALLKGGNDEIWRAIRYLDLNKHQIEAPRPVEPMAMSMGVPVSPVVHVDHALGVEATDA